MAELEVQRGDNRVRIRLSLGSEVQHSAAPHRYTDVQSPMPSTTAPAPTAGAVKEEAAPPGPDASLTLVKSPIVGTFYEAPRPDSPPFVRVGEQVQPGKVLCIIESMKLMNEIEAEIAGIVESKLVPNGQPVEYGEALFAIRPL